MKSAGDVAILSRNKNTLKDVLGNIESEARERGLLINENKTKYMEVTRTVVNPLKPNCPYRGRTAPLTSKICILYIYSTNIGTEYFKHGICSPFSPLQNAVCFIILVYLVPVLFTFYIQNVLKLKKNNSGAKKLMTTICNAENTNLNM